jgi:hypothetical protein
MNWVRPSLSRRSLDKRLSRRNCGFIKSSAFPIRFYLRPESNAPAVPRPREKPGFSVSHGSRGGFWLKLRFTKSGRNPFHWCLVWCASSLAARAHARRCPTARIIRRLSDEATTEERRGYHRRELRGPAFQCFLTAPAIADFATFRGRSSDIASFADVRRVQLQEA